MTQFPIINSSLMIPTNNNLNSIPTTTVTTTQLVPTTHLIPTFPTTYVLNAVTPSFFYDSTMLARPVFRQEIPLFGYTVNKNHEENTISKNDHQESTDSLHSTNKSNNSCCCCCCCCRNTNNNNNTIESNETKTNEIDTTLTKTSEFKQEIDCHTIQEETNKSEFERNDLHLNELSLEEKIRLIRKELNLSNKEEMLENNPICYCKTSNSLDLNNGEEEKDLLINSSGKTKYLVNYMPVHKAKCAICSYNDNLNTNRPKSRTSVLSARKSRSKSPKHWMPIGRNDYSSTRLHYNEYNSDITKVQHLGGLNTSSAKTNTASGGDTSQVVEKPLKYYTITTKTPAKTIIRTTINSSNYFPQLKTKETMSSVKYTPTSVNLSKWSMQNF